MPTERMCWPMASLLIAGFLASPLSAGTAPPVPPAATVAAVTQVEVLRGDRVVAAGETTEGDVLVVGGDLRVLGTVRGNAVVAGGNLFLGEGGRVLGDVNVAGGEIQNDGGRITGEVRVVNRSAKAQDRPEARRVGSPVTAAARSEGTWFTPIAEGIAGLFGTFALAVVLAGAGAVLIFYGVRHLRIVSETVRASVVRCAAVGVAASFLIVPAFLALIVLLAVSIVGIPLLAVAIPLYPVAVAGAFGFGLLAVAHAAGERTAERGGTPFGRYRNAYGYLFAGLAMLLAPLLAANLLTIAGMELLSTLIKLAVAGVAWAAATVGVGAVILSRAGTRDTFATRPWEAGTEPDGAWDAEPLVGHPRT